MMPPRGTPQWDVLHWGKWLVALWVGLVGLANVPSSLQSGYLDPLVPVVLAMVALLYLALLWAGMIVARDAWERGLPPLTWGLLTVTPLGLVSLVVYLVVREGHPPLAWSRAP